MSRRNMQHIEQVILSAKKLVKFDLSPDDGRALEQPPRYIRVDAEEYQQLYAALKKLKEEEEDGQSKS